MSKEFKEVKEHAQYLVSTYSARNTLYDSMEKIFLLKDDEINKVQRQWKNAKITLHPGARNNAIGAIRLLTAADPEFSVPMDTNQANAKTISDTLEKMAKAMWMASGRIRQRPIHYDVVTSAIVFAEMHIAITKTADMLEQAKTSSKAMQLRMEEIAATTPYLFDVWDPRTGYPDMDETGLTVFYNEVETLSGKIIDEFGDKAKKVLKDDRRYTKLRLCRFWNNENRWIWVRGYDNEPIVEEAHGLPFIPVTVQLGEGSSLFTLPEDQRQPFLYTEHKSGLWMRRNLVMTVMHNQVFAIGSNPMFVYRANQPGKKLALDFSKPGGTVTIEKDESLDPMVKNVIDPSMRELLTVDEQLGDESTIYGQALGEPLGGNAPFSLVALLNQAGRLPLTVPQRMASWAIADATKKAMLWLRADGKQAKASYEDITAELAPKDIPEHFELNCKLDIALPQDKAQMINVATQAAGGERPLVSQRFAREEYLGIGQSDEMQKEIMSEMAGSANFTIFMQAMLLKMQQMMEQGQAQGATRPGQGQMPPGQTTTPPMQAQPTSQTPPMQPQEPIPSGYEGMEPGSNGGVPPEEMM